jgi:spore coat polysaccharide biosynthesis predicted glycosyltransferase SpsG
MKKIAFKVAFSEKIGSGHIYRCARLSESLKKKGVITYFLLNKKIGYKLSFLTKSFSFCIVKKNFEDEKNFLKSKKIKNLLIDDPKVDFKKQKKYKLSLDKLLIYQDLPSKNCADILNNHNYIKEGLHKYKNLSYKKCKFYLGPKYYLFNKFKSFNKKENLITIFLGGNISIKLLDNILKIISYSTIKKSKIIVFNGIFKKNIKFLKQKYSKLQIYFRSQNKQQIFFETISKSKIFFSSCGSTILESIYLKTPTIAFIRAKNQKNNCLNLSKDKLIHYSKIEFKINNFINTILNNKKYYKRLVGRLDNYKKKNFTNKLTIKIFNQIK